MLTKRMQAIVRMAGDCPCVADIGCDHGLVCAAMLREGMTTRAIAADISAASLRKAQELAQREGLEGFETRLGDGLSVLKPDEAQVIIIAGMGGLLMQEMLQASPQVAREARLVLSPNRNAPELRRFLAKEGYGIANEALVLEREKYYPVMIARWGEQRETNPLFYYVGKQPLMRKDEEMKAFLQQRIAACEKILAALPEGRGVQQSAVQQELEYYMEAKKWL